MRVEIIKTDGTRSVVEVPRLAAIAKIEKHLGARRLDSFSLRDGRVMFVDDNGYDSAVVHDGPVTTLVPVKRNKAINHEATRLYHSICKPGTTHQIVGDVAIVKDEDFA